MKQGLGYVKMYYYGIRRYQTSHLHGRIIEVVATGLPVHHGIPLAIDVTMVAPLHADGTAWNEAYPELVGSSVLRLLVAAMETGGRVCAEAIRLLDQAAHAKARSAPVPLQKSAARSWRARWVTMLSVAGQDALAATLVSDGVGELDGKDGPDPLPVEVWLDA